jgi:hypothetical protein
MAWNTKARAAKTDTDQPKAQTSKRDNKRPWADLIDKNGNGRIDIDDLLIGLRETFQWVFSWRGAMLVCGGFTFMASLVNIAAWANVLTPLGSAAIGTGFLVWGTLQTLELMPILDDLSLKASLGALVRLQRKPVEIPVVNHELSPIATTKFKKYRNRERNREMTGEFIRYACYGVELAVLVIGGGVLSPIGINWASVLMSIVGIVGVEIGLRKTNECGEKLMNADEREFMKQLEASVKRTSVTAAGETAKA